MALIKKERIDLALADLNKAISINSNQPVFYAWRGAAWSATNELDKALEDLNRAIQLRPKDAAFYSMRGSVHNKRQRFEEAVADFKQALELNAGSLEAQNNLAWLRATCPDGSFRDGKEAVALASKACEMTNYKFPNLLDTLAAAHAEAGDFDQALRYENQSFEKLTVTNKSYAGMKERLALYQEHKPYRQKPEP